MRIGFIGAARSELARDLRGLLAMDKFIENPRPIAFGIGVVIGMLSRCDLTGRKDGIRREDIQPEVIGIPSGIARVSDCDWIRRVVLAIRETRQEGIWLRSAHTGSLPKGMETSLSVPPAART